MKVNDQILTPENYRFVIADEKDIAAVVFRKDDRKLWTFKEAIDSLRQEGEALRIWLEILRDGVPAFARVHECHNLVPSVLRDSFAELISGTTVTPTFKANYFSLGTGSTAPSNSDTQLATESLRALFANRYSASNIAYLDVFFGSALVGGNSYNEAGIHVDGSGSANSGYLLSRTLQSLSLGASQTLTVNCTITIS